MNDNSQLRRVCQGTMNNANTLEFSPLGKSSTYTEKYDPTLLFPIPRIQKRQEIGIDEELPFIGVDIWNAYEISWLNKRGVPQIAAATFIVPADSSHIIESKSFKLYLSSFNQTRLNDYNALLTLLKKDISENCGAPVQIELIVPEQVSEIKFQELDGLLLDQLDVEIDHYQPDPTLLQCEHDKTLIEEKLVSHLLKSNCLVTGQPDWGSVQIHYVGCAINKESLLKYLVGFRNHHEFHEQCVERIFTDIMAHCKPEKLSVYARYTRRGGLDINPWRSNFQDDIQPLNFRLFRQ